MRLWDHTLVYGSALFQGIGRGDTDELLRFLHGRVEIFQKGELFYRSGEQRELCCLLAGRAIAFQYDYWGNRAILSHLDRDSMLVGSASMGNENSAVDAEALETCTVLFTGEEAYHAAPLPSLQGAFNRFNANLVGQLSKMYLQMLEKNNVLEQRTIRKKLMAYLSNQALQHGCREFTIPMNRQELADYLYVDRCALSHELSRMQAEGLLRYRRSSFCLSEIDGLLLKSGEKKAGAEGKNG